VIFIRMLQGKNGHRVPTSLTFNAIWHTEGFISGVDSVWSYYEGIDKGVKPMSVREYCQMVQPKAQELLDQAIQDEAALNPFK